LRGWKGGTFMVGPGRHLALLGHWLLGLSFASVTENAQWRLHVFCFPYQWVTLKTFKNKCCGAVTPTAFLFPKWTQVVKLDGKDSAESIVWANSFNPQLGRTGSRGRWSAASGLSRHPDHSRQAAQRSMDWVNNPSWFTAAGLSTSFQKAVLHFRQAEWHCFEHDHLSNGDIALDMTAMITSKNWCFISNNGITETGRNEISFWGTN